MLIRQYVRNCKYVVINGLGKSWSKCPMKIPNSFTAVSQQFQDSFMYHSKVSMQSSRPLQTTA